MSRRRLTILEKQKEDAGNAVDVQRNRNVAMLENSTQVIKPSRRERIVLGSVDQDEGQPGTTSTEGNDRYTAPVHLPDEIIVQILDYVQHQPTQQQTLVSCVQVSRQWYGVAIPLLYRSPVLYGHNYEPFVRVICPSINQHVRKSPLSSLVKVLDMRKLVHQGSKSMTARVLGRTKGNLQEFYAPQASFAINCLPALGKCSRLKVLDLTLVSESPPLVDLFKTISHLTELRTLRLPRSSGFGVQQIPSTSPVIVWPPNLQELCLSGGIDASFVHGIVAFPQTLRALTIQRCPNAQDATVEHLIKTAVRPLEQLESLKIAHMPRLSYRGLNDVLRLLPQLKRLSVSIDYVTSMLFDEHPDDEEVLGPFLHANLRTLELTYSGARGVEAEVAPFDLIVAVETGSLPRLTQVWFDQSHMWQDADDREDIARLTDILQDRARRDWKKRRGMFSAEEMDKWEYERPEVWEEMSGVWEL